ncbi:MAG: 2-oxo acid dehydrogenase subunit E2 [Nocardioidaceae bacterium]|nr:2-oxo acid dehydrogenase subunit E2 [Nocardioidaceae bacterium]MCL2613982.1 2-oxo acid dehydrogenase subunit E2 [Nocardioidaceae bacterium]
MASLFVLPEIAADTTEAVLTAWSVAPREPFVAGAPLAVVETAKAAVELTSETDGAVLALLVDPGADVTVGQPLALLGRPGEEVEDLDATLAALGARAAPSGAPATAPEPPAPADQPAASAAPAGRVFASPLARRLAHDAGLDIARIPGTGPRNRVRKRDVEAAKAARTAPATTAATGEPAEPWSAPAVRRDDEVPHSRMRRAIAERLVTSVRTAPHFYVRGTATVEDLLSVRRQLDEGGIAKVSVNDLVVKAVALAHVAVPEMNVVWTDDAVRRFSSVDVAVAVATDGGLLTPVVRDAAALPIAELARRTADLGDRARNGRLTPAELSGGTISVSNLGMYGVEEFSAIINPPHAAILAVGAAAAEPTVVDDRVVVAQRLHVTLSVDHRPVDGVVAARWMRAFLDLLEHPIRLVL